MEIILLTTSLVSSSSYTVKEDWTRPSLENLEFDNFDYISEQKADCLEREFKKDEVKVAFFEFGGDKALGSYGFPLAFF